MTRRFLSQQSAPTRARRGRTSLALVEAMEPRQLLSVSFYQGPVLGPGGPSSVVADLNGDGKPDVVNFNPSMGQVQVFANQGNGTFGPAIDLPVSGGVDDVAVGDFNGDGVPDIAVANATGSISVYLGAGTNVNGTNPAFLAPVVTTFSTLTGGGSIQTAHFGGSMDDLVMDTSSTVYGSGVVCVLLATGGGHFAEPDAANFLTGELLSQPVVEVDVPTFVIADLNGDGISDIAAAQGSGVTVQFGAIGGSFLTSQYDYSVPDGASGDIDAAVLTSGGGTNLPDLIVETGGLSGSSINDVSVLLNNGGGSFAPAVAYPVDSSVFEAVGDFDGDGSLDIAAGSQVLLNTGAGTFGPAQDDNLPNISIASLDTLTLAAADFNGDAHADLLVNGGDVFFEGTNPNGGGGGGGSGSNTSPLTPVVGKDTLPKSVVSGSTTHSQVTVNVTNSGSTTSTGTTTVAIYASTDGDVDSNSILLGTVSRKLVLKAHAHAAVVVSIKSLSASLNGSYTLLAKVTDPSKDTSVSSTGSTLTAAAPFLSFSETLISTTLAASDVAGKKTRATVKLKITNAGNIPSTGKSTVALYLSPDMTAADGTLVHSVKEAIALKPNASKVVSVPLASIPSLASGNYHLVAQVTDPKGNITSVGSTGTYALTAS